MYQIDELRNSCKTAVENPPKNDDLGINLAFYF
jgi:hypothetical protein